MRLFDRYRTDAVYNTRAVVQRTGVPADTLRAWERRYGMPSPPRTLGNQRLYSDRDVAIISWLRDQTRQGLSISQAVTVLSAELALSPADAPANQETAPPVSHNGHSNGDAVATKQNERLIEYRNQLIASLASFDTGSADRVVEEVIALVSVDHVCRYVLAAAMIEIGDRWKNGEVAIAVEHFSTSYVMRKLASLFNLSLPQHGRGPIVAAAVEGELHELGLLLTCLILSRHGYKIVYLGANLPVEELLVVIEDVNPALVLLSSTTELTYSALKRTIAAIHDHGLRNPLAIPAPAIGYGGRLFIDEPDRCTDIPAIYMGDNQEEVVASVDRLMSTNVSRWSS